uniref:Uncoupling protein 2 n=1 Tax=Sus scrofa TaxID=9823 RepID=A0A8D2CEV6_PIG
MVGFKATEVPPTATVKFLGAGTAACIADLITFPLDTAKVRLQIQGERRGPVQAAASAQYRGVLGTILTMVRNEGPRSLYNGLVAGLQRQMSFASIRIGLYDSVKHFYTKGSEHAGIGSRLLAGSTTGALAVAVAQPTDVVKVRFQAQARAGGGRRYRSTVDAYKTIAREEGLRGLWKGTSPNVARNAIVNCAELVTYDLIKDTLLKADLMTGGAGEMVRVSPFPRPRSQWGLRGPGGHVFSSCFPFACGVSFSSTGPKPRGMSFPWRREAVRLDRQCPSGPQERVQLESPCL